jgi:hypothetical protein
MPRARHFSHMKILNRFTGAIIKEGANLRGANLRGANLAGVNLTGADLTGADLAGADLAGADLAGANLRVADLAGANLTGANLRGANLTVADLAGADLTGADLTGADLAGADLTGADLPEITNARLKITPEGRFTAWKQLRDGIICELLIPADAKRSNSTGRKCRAEKAVIVKLSKAGKDVGIGYSLYDSEFAYQLGETVTAKTWEENRWIECGGGIHFYITREEAEAHT